MANYDWEAFKIPVRWRDATFHKENVEGVYKKVIAFVDGSLPDGVNSKYPAWSCFLTGETGIGKTHLCCEALKHHVQTKKWPTNMSAQFLTVNDYFDMVHLYFDNQIELNNHMEALCEREFLVLDDFGVTRNTEWHVKEIYRLFEERHNRRKKTLISSNLSLEVVEKIYGNRLYRRLLEGIYINQTSKSPHCHTLDKLEQPNIEIC